MYSSALTVIAVCNLQKPHSCQAALAVFFTAAEFHVCDFAAALQSVFVSDTESMMFICKSINQV